MNDQTNELHTGGKNMLVETTAKPYQVLNATSNRLISQDSHKSIQNGSLDNPRDISRATTIIKNGVPVVAQVYGVFGLWMNGTSQIALENVKRVKSEKPDQQRPFSSMSFSSDIAGYIDYGAIHPDLLSLVKDPKILERVVGTMLHLRLPLNDEGVKAVPLSMRSQQNGRWVIHNLDPSGHPIAGLISSLNKQGVKFVAVTTLNTHGQPEITKREEAEQFSSQKGLGLLLQDPAYQAPSVRGSFTIVDTISGDVLRMGNLPLGVVGRLVGKEIKMNGAQPAKFDTAPDLELLLKDAKAYNYPPELVRALIHNYIRGNVRFK